MKEQKVDMFIMMNNKNFEATHLPILKEMLSKVDDTKWMNVEMLQFKSPTTSLIVSLLAGSLGIDRFMIGDVGLGIGKLLTCGGAGIWTIVDWFMIQQATKEKNMKTIQEALALL
jgi:TM2 domain-containing membrane protein YozV